MLKGFGEAYGCLAKQFLKFAAVVERPLHLGYEFFGNINRESPSFHSDVQEMAGVLVPLPAGFAVLTDARAPTQTQGAQSGRPETCGMIPEPLFNVGSGFFFGWHVLRMPYSLRTVKGIPSNALNAIIMSFETETN
jgi:hypothetical protein